MISSLSAFRIRKKGSTDVTDFEDMTPQVRLTDCPLMIPTEFKPVHHISFPDEDGIETYELETPKYKEFDQEFRFAFVAERTKIAHDVITNIATTFNGLNEIYCPWSAIGRTNCRLKRVNISSIHYNSSREYVVEFGIVFTIEDPVTVLNPF